MWERGGVVQIQGEVVGGKLFGLVHHLLSYAV